MQPESFLNVLVESPWVVSLVTGLVVAVVGPLILRRLAPEPSRRAGAAVTQTSVTNVNVTVNQHISQSATTTNPPTTGVALIIGAAAIVAFFALFWVLLGLVAGIAVACTVMFVLCVRDARRLSLWSPASTVVTVRFGFSVSVTVTVWVIVFGWTWREMSWATFLDAFQVDGFGAGWLKTIIANALALVAAGPVFAVGLAGTVALSTMLLLQSAFDLAGWTAFNSSLRRRSDRLGAAARLASRYSSLEMRGVWVDLVLALGIVILSPPVLLALYELSFESNPLL